MTVGGTAFEGRAAFVTDGWHGLGREVSDRFLDAGAAVGVGYRVADPYVDAFAEKRTGRPLSLHQGRLTDPDDCRRALAELTGRRGRLDVLVAMLNFPRTGLLSAYRPLSRLTEGEWHRAVDLHLSGAFTIAQAALEHMLPARSGRIVFVLGPAGVGDRQGHHATVRSGLRTLGVELAREVAARGVTVNLVSVGMVDHDALAELPPEAVEQVRRRLPAGRFAQLDEVTRVVEFLAHPDSGYLNGQVLAVDGGLTLG